MVEKAHQNEMKVVATTKGSDVIDFMAQYHPYAIMLNINLQDTNAWKVVDRLKNDLTLRHIPVYVTSSTAEDRDAAMKRGARNFLVKPISSDKLAALFRDIEGYRSKKTKTLLLVDDTDQDLKDLEEQLSGSDVEITTAMTAKAAIEAIRRDSFDCIVLDLLLPDANGLEIIKELEDQNSDPETSLIVYSAKDLTQKEKSRLSQFAHRIILKTPQSMANLVDQVALFLHREHALLPERMRTTIENYCQSEDVLKGKTVLIVDDDMRNLFALTTALERFNLNIITAESGQEAIDTLERQPNIDIVLMDIMMPEMDGYETMKRIRKEEKNKDMTIIAVTAKAMKGDRQKCIESGASDYMTKPVNVDQLLGLMRVWLK
jgi:CheY-like chemotaxis protein